MSSKKKYASVSATTLRSLKKLNKKMCSDFFASATQNDDGDTYYINPLSDKPVKKGSSTFNAIAEKCYDIDSIDETDDDKIANKFNTWFSNPLYDPFHSKQIKYIDFDDKNDYAKLYSKAFQHFTEVEKKNEDEVQSILPKDHVLFGTLDILFIKQVKTHKYNSFINSIIEAFLQDNIYNDYIKEYSSHNELSDFKPLEFKFLSYFSFQICDLFISIVSRYFSVCSNGSIILSDFLILNNTNAMLLANEKLKLFKEFLNEYSIYQEFTNVFRYYLLKHLTYAYNSRKDRPIFHVNNIKNLYVPILLRHKNNIIDTIISYHQELLDLINYKTNPDKSPFRNIENKVFNEIEDPLIKILDDIGVNNIDLSTLELPTRPFKNDKEFETYNKKYNTLRDSYNKKVKSWKDNDKDTTPPKRPILELPNGTKINVTIQPLPKYIKDNEYKVIRDTYHKNEKTINAYKNLIDIGVLDLMKKSVKSSSPSKVPKFVDKDREYFNNHVFNIEDDDKLKCNDNTDIITQENFDDPRYLLSKLQLLYQLHTKDDNGKVIRTDCFYAPNFYNYIISKVNKKETLKNPVTKQNLTDENIQELMKIMNFIDPEIEFPRYMKPAHDTKLVLRHTVINYGGIEYYTVSLDRLILNDEIYLKIITVCTFPANIDVRDTQSADMSSDVMLFSIYKLFNDGKLLHTYMPPYKLISGSYLIYYKPSIHFANFKTYSQWAYLDKEQRIKLFIDSLEEVKSFL